MCDSPVIRTIGKSGQRGAGPYITFEFDWSGEVVMGATFECHACPSMIRCGDWVCKWAVGRASEQLALLECADLIVVVGGLPLGKEFFAVMAVEALKQVLNPLP